jgi:hypothetical protein
VALNKKQELCLESGEEKVSGTEKLIWPKRFLTPFPFRSG